METDLENILRPKRLDDFTGQTKLRENLGIFIAAARSRQEALDHVLLAGPPGLGKTTLAHIIAREMDAVCHTTSGPILNKAGDLAALLTNLQAKDVLFIDEIHRMPPKVEEILYSAMEDFKIDLLIGQGPAARSVRIDLPHFTLIGATTRMGLISTPLRERFGIPMRLEFYNSEAITHIVLRAATCLTFPLMETGAIRIAQCSRGTPRIACRLLRRVRDFCMHTPSLQAVEDALARLDMNDKGLDAFDRHYLDVLANKFTGGPVGVEALAAALHEERGTLEDLVEPYLMQLGLLNRTPRGRLLTKRGFQYVQDNAHA